MIDMYIALFVHTDTTVQEEKFLGANRVLPTWYPCSASEPSKNATDCPGTKVPNGFKKIGKKMKMLFRFGPSVAWLGRFGCAARVPRGT